MKLIVDNLSHLDLFSWVNIEEFKVHFRDFMKEFSMFFACEILFGENILRDHLHYAN